MIDEHLISTLRTTLQFAEGFRNEVYLDSEGLPTCGWGHQLYVGSKVPKQACEAFLDLDMAEALVDYHRLPQDLQITLSSFPVREQALIEMFFLMGYQRTMWFTRMWVAIRQQDWDTAAREVLDSNFGRKQPRRATRISNMILLNEMPKE